MLLMINDLFLYSLPLPAVLIFPALTACIHLTKLSQPDWDLILFSTCLTAAAFACHVIADYYSHSLSHFFFFLSLYPAATALQH